MPVILTPAGQMAVLGVRRRVQRGADTRGGYGDGVRVDGAVTGRVTRWLVLTCTVIGAEAMDTLGHARSHTGGPHAAGHSAPGSVLAGQPARVSAQAGAGHGTASLAVLTATVVALVDKVVHGCPGDGCAHAQPGPEPGRHEPPTWGVCLAVLAALSAAVLVAWLMIGRATRATVAVRQVAGPLGESRAPPRRGFGLQLASVSVMRT